MNQSSMILIIFRQNRGGEEKVDFLAISLDEKWWHFIGQAQKPDSIEVVKGMARLYLGEEDIFEVESSVIDGIGAVFMLEKMGFLNKGKRDQER